MVIFPLNVRNMYKLYVNQHITFGDKWITPIKLNAAEAVWMIDTVTVIVLFSNILTEACLDQLITHYTESLIAG